MSDHKVLRLVFAILALLGLGFLVWLLLGKKD